MFKLREERRDMGANTTYVVFGYEMVEKKIEVSALTYSDAMEKAAEEGLLGSYDAKPKDEWEDNDE